MVLVLALLFSEYRFYHTQVQKILELKVDYQNHLVGINRVFDEYNKTKERLEQFELQLDSKKKTLYEKLASESDSNEFPVGARVFSSDELLGDDDNFVVINRELEYLKQSALEYVRKKNLNLVLQGLHLDEWKNYTELVLAQDKARIQKKRTRKKIKRKTGISKPRVASAYKGPKDIAFSWPIKRSNFWLSSFFGPRKKANGTQGFHYGVDMAALRGTSVRVAASGVVVEARYASGYGKTIVVAHNRKYRTRYAHLDKILVKAGQKIKRGQLIGKVGDTGYVRKKGRDASHLHFEVYTYGKKVNPMYFLA